MAMDQVQVERKYSSNRWEDDVPGFDTERYPCGTAYPVEITGMRREKRKRAHVRRG